VTRFLAGYRRVLDGIGRVEWAVAVVAMAVIVTAIFAQVVSRYLFGQPLVWVEELSTYAFIWGSFVGASAGLKRGMHLKIESFVGRLTDSARRGLRVVLDALMIVFCVILTVNGFNAMVVFEWHQRTIALPVELPRYLFYSTPLILASASMVLTLLHDLLDAVAGRDRTPPRAGPAVV
jgi:TRAP-type C4-dicarboxylate transport system permease small subunit